MQRDHELSEIASTLTDLGMMVDDCRAGLPSEEDLAAATLVVASAQRLLERSPPHLSSWPTTLVTIKDPSKTLSAHLHRIGASMILCLPVHPQALRLLLLHEIYRGPERRIRKRTPIGHRVRVRSGLFGSKATLLELSPTGARLLMARMPKPGTKLRLQLGRELTLGRPLKLEAKVVRRIEDSEATSHDPVQVGLSFLDASAHSATLGKILARFADGPAVWKACRSDRASAPLASAAEPSNERSTSPDSPDSDAQDVSDRRENARVPYDRRIVALDEEAARVLVGCDLSAGGMRVVSNSSIALNDRLRVALHCGIEMEPLVVMARVHRDDGDDGLVLVFEDLTADQATHLEKIVAHSGSIRSPLPSHQLSEEADRSLVVGEWMEALPENGREPWASEVPENAHSHR